MLPAYIRLKFNQKCLACNEFILAGKNAFYIKEGNQVFHAACGKPEWKVSGSPYDIRIQAAIAHRLDKMSDQDLIKLALRRFRKELEIKADKLNLKTEVYQYLVKNKLISNQGYESQIQPNGKYELVKVYTSKYSITPRGFNWDVDQSAVREPRMNEDIMLRDVQLEPKAEE